MFDEAKFAKMLATVLVSRGHLVGKENYYSSDGYDQADEKTLSHLTGSYGHGEPRCGGWGGLKGMKDETVHVFAGTFAESSDKVVLLSARVTCRCGKIKDGHMILAGGLAALLESMAYLENKTVDLTD